MNKNFFISNKLKEISITINTLEENIYSLKKENESLKKEIKKLRSKGLIYKTIDFLKNLYTRFPDIEISLDTSEKNKKSKSNTKISKVA